MKQLSPKQIQFLDDVAKGIWSINSETGLIDVDGDLIVPDSYIKDGKLLVSFGKVTGKFNVQSNELTTLEGCPYWVGINFSCNYNRLTTLKYAPKYIGNDALVWNNPLESIDWNPEHIGGDLCIDLRDFESEYHGIIIPEIEALIAKGIRIFGPDLFYNKLRNAYIDSKMIDLL